MYSLTSTALLGALRGVQVSPAQMRSIQSKPQRIPFHCSQSWLFSCPCESMWHKGKSLTTFQKQFTDNIPIRYTSLVLLTHVP